MFRRRSCEEPKLQAPHVVSERPASSSLALARRRCLQQRSASSRFRPAAPSSCASFEELAFLGFGYFSCYFQPLGFSFQNWVCLF